jgi:TrmH family RNA methyltransferase
MGGSVTAAMEVIRSAKHDKISALIELGNASKRRGSPLVPVYGEEALDWAIGAGLKIDSLYISETGGYGGALPGVKTYRVSDFLNKKITGYSHVIDVCALAEKKPESIEDAMGNREAVVILDRVLDHGNIGTIIRAMRCFGYGNLVFTNYYMDAYYKNIVNSSRGEAFKIVHDSIDAEKIIASLKRRGYKIYATSSDYTININDACRFPQPYAVIFGNETDGIGDELMSLSDGIIGCPISKDVDSLNVGVAAGIILNRMSLSDSEDA